ASSTDTHLDLILEGIKAGKAVFCEKPLDLDLGRVDERMDEIEAADTPVLVGFNRRYDPNFKAVHDAIANGKIGDLEMVKITSRDPGPPPIEYINVSGGLFRDMMIHDFDLARWLLGEDPVEVFASASCLVDPAIGNAGDIDTAVVTMKTASGKLCQIDNSRRAVYGYDQRMEVFGSKGMAKADNVQTNTVEVWDGDRVHREKPPYFFLERYAEAYRAELDHFVDVVSGKAEPAVTARDGRQALALADAALTASQSGQAQQLG
ncbi:TPA: inositol 2-dehydrogenase, partial [Candidatus Latescibacteria bacterium]|nr:inositol 2-dehydrogenase [Candidatus Latescibacterota bacterium]